jgi:GntR family transcriptional repressor for pyruvate dehydrogenase complex
LAVTDEAIEKIKGMIVSGALQPGQRLPKEADLATGLGLSRNSLREAVKALSLMNILDVRQGDGTYVTSLESPLLLEALSFIVDFHRDDQVLEFLAVRRILEPAAAALAANTISAEQLVGLRKVLDSAGPADAIDKIIAADVEFHRGITLATGNQVLCSLLEGLATPTMRARAWRGMTEPAALERTFAEHASILLALEARDAEAARAWSTVHIANLERWLASVL